MLKKLTKEKLAEIETIAKDKLDVIKDRIDKMDYKFLLREIAIDMGYAFSDENFKDDEIS